MKIRVGQGYDVHKLAEGESLWIGGIQLEHSKGTVAHSDGDVLIHAICDALLGAANLRDIGYHFPDTSPEFKNADSKQLLKETCKIIASEGYTISNIDTTICLEQPKMKPHINQMKVCLSEVMGIPKEDISIKATTTEKLGFVGREEGISAHAIALIHR